ncbi:hypothetical protein [Marinimicrobium locisalis]|uniref:hypothetical protein n=1 Tax=Marinimicrobium locisalis TaxID=546022 RepID=UPI003221740C
MQQVNLYLPEFQPRRVWLNLPQMGAVLGLVLLLIILLSFFSAARTDALSEEVAAEREQLQALQAQVEALAAELPARRGQSIEEQVAELRAEVARREQILRLITQQNLGNADGFSEQLVSLARHAPEELALSAFSLQSGGQYVEMAGRVRQPEVVPLYLQRLRGDSSFADVRLGVLEVAREPDDIGPGLQFSVKRVQQQEAATERQGRNGGRNDG